MASFSPRAEMLLAGVWTDITDRVFKRGDLRHTRGSSTPVVIPDPGDCRPQLNNKDGRFSPDNPVGPYYGQIDRNTPFRVSARAGTPGLDLTGNFTDAATTPDLAALDITGDIDVRLDATLANWTGYTASINTVHLVGKLDFSAGTKSWFVGTRDGLLYWEWSADGSNALSASSTAPPPVASNGRQAVRVTMDVDNGASGRTITFYTAPTMSGPWQQLGDTVVQAGTTSIFNSSTPLRIGQATGVNFTPPLGRFNSVQVRNGINGALVASPDFTVQAVGTTGFTDSAGRVWSLAGSASITDRRVRLYHEMAALPTRWHVSGKDVWVDGQSAGLLRRLGRGGKPLKSALRRRIPSYAPLAYWPMEEGSSATKASSPIAGVRSLSLTGVQWAQEDSLPSSEALPVLSSSTGVDRIMMGRVPAPASTLTEWGVQWLYRQNSVNTALRTFMRILSTGTVTEWSIQIKNDTTRVLGKDDDGNTIFTQDVATGTDLYNQWIKVEFNAVQNGGNVNWHLGFVKLDGSASAINSSFAGTIGRPTAVASPAAGYSADLDGMAIGHISVWPSDDTAAFDNALNGWTGETAGARLRRLATEEALPLRVNGAVALETPLGPQRTRAVLDLIGECVEADGGMLYEERGRGFLRYRDRNSLYNQPAQLVLDYTAPGLAPPLEPTPDDDGVTNDVTVSREDGASGQAVLDDGRLSVQSPPNGIGTGYDTSTTLNLATDDQAEPIAYWRLHLGTVEGPRYPRVHVMLHRASDLADQILAVDIGDKIIIRNPPAWLPPGDIELIVQGYEETIDEYAWDVIFNCTPATPWTVGDVQKPAGAWVDTSGSQLATAATSTATTLDVLATAGLPWTNDPFDSPWDLKISGEEVRVAAGGRLVNSNPFFDTDTSSWSAQNGSISWSTEIVHPQARGSLFITPNGTSTEGGATCALTPVGSIIPGASYVLSMWVYSPSGQTLDPSVDWFTAGGSYISTGFSAGTAVPAGQWTFLKITAVAPATASRASMRARHAGTPSQAQTWFAWAVRITQAKASWLHDAFGRTVSSSWGTSDAGLAWNQVGGGSASDYNVGSGYGSHILSTLDTSRRSAVTAPHADFDIYCDITTSALATGTESLYGAVTARMQDASNMYMARLQFTTSNTIVLSLRKVIADVQTELGTYTLAGITHVAGTFIRVRFQGRGTALKAKAWLASSSFEPGVWNIEATDSAITAANQYGTRSIRPTGNTNAATVEVRYDNYDVVTPQIFTVARSRNAIVKAQAAGADVRLARPTIVAL
ncbi:carbohydrate binding domain-containing protein [Streptomyces cylindrosporus]|uniref:CBM-cenC domain-containing protein n=1 Tax=Streptomyces cylindrosporus TaxID=2927583 RepID=A0ABS9Y2F6_9ACTN|nr:carbohydrate binding domain-containing protein [Streptomyces cylindrosporus]MCI3271389.1 hypothetical protein [Streptomyces cylindrosporus]